MTEMDATRAFTAAEEAAAVGARPSGDSLRGHPVSPRVLVIGGGVMGRTLAAALLNRCAADDVEVVEPNDAAATAIARDLGVRVHGEAVAPAARADVVLLAVKPALVPSVLTAIAPALRGGAVVASVAAGVPIAVYERVLAPLTPVVRIMPNTPALIGKGATAICAGTHATGGHLALVQSLLGATGLVVVVGEQQMDAVTALSGSGPAYAYYLIDAMAEAGVLLGLTRDVALQLAAATVQGAAAMVVETGEHPVVLRERVSSPGGTTVAGVRELDAHGVRAGVIAAVEAARDRSRELAAQAAKG